MLAMECQLCRRRGQVEPIDRDGLELVCAFCGGPGRLLTDPQATGRAPAQGAARAETRPEARQARARSS